MRAELRENGVFYVLPPFRVKLTTPIRGPSYPHHRIPTHYMIECGDKRWRRVYCSCVSNSGTLYVETVANRFNVVRDSDIEDALARQA
jgi:hypothetical protein